MNEVKFTQKIIWSLPFPAILVRGSRSDFELIFANEAFLKITGKKVDEVIGESLSDHISESGKNGLSDLLNALKNVFQKGKEVQVSSRRYIFQDRNSEWFGEKTFKVILTPINDSKSSRLTLLTFYEDLSRDKQGSTYEQNKKLERLRDETQKIARVGSWEVDLQKNTFYWSDMIKEIHEVSPDYEPDLESAILFYKEGEDREKIREVVQNAINTGEAFDVELQIITEKGNKRWVRVTGKSKMKDGATIRIFGATQDIHKKKMTELESMRVLKNFHERVKEQQCLYEISKLCNLKTETDDLLARAVEIIPEGWQYPDITVASIKYGDKIWQTKGFVETDWTLRCKKDVSDKHSLSITVSYTKPKPKLDIGPFLKEEKLLLESIISNLVLATERIENLKKLEELNTSLQKRTAELTRSNNELEQFAFVTSHDLQEPLRMITSFLTQLEKKYGEQLDEKARRYIYYAKSGAKRMRQVILDLLEFSKMGADENKKTTIDLNEIVNEVLSQNRRMVEELYAVINVNELPVIQGYKPSIRQLFRNLIVNALKYHQEGQPPKINLSAEETDKQWLFSVRDNGIGIDPAYHEKIFEIFQRLHNFEEFEGTGIGLAICKKAVQRHGGEIWIESQPGIGSTFYFTIPK
ncbi:MAG: PAS domain-containing protein [Balneolaceae bacterium]|nr:PAS domain-containing protein [Balneolaceae bacterium]